MTVRRGLPWLLVGVAAVAGLLVQLPMAQAARWLAPATRGALSPLAAQGVWHDGVLHLACATPGGRRLDCGRYAVDIRRAGLGARVALAQAGGGSVRLTHGGLAWQVEATGWRMPAAALAAWLPVAEQMQVGGQLVIDGQADGAGKLAVHARWQGEIGEFSIGEQNLRVEGTAQRFKLRFVPPGEPGSAGVAVSGEVTCEAFGKAPRCRGEVLVSADGADRRLVQLLAAAGRQVGPGRYRFVVDAS